MDIQKALTFFTDDERWTTKLGIAAVMGLLSIFIIPFIMLTGYGVELARNVRDGQKNPLPEWDFGRHFSLGLGLCLAQLAYALPVILLLVIGGGITFIGALASGSSESASDAIGAVMGGSFLLLCCLSLILLLAMALIMPAVVAQYIRMGTFASCFQFGEIMKITRTHLSTILLLLAVSLGLSFVIGTVAGILPIIGFLISMAAGAYTTTVSYHLYGQFASMIDGKKPENLFTGSI